MSLWFDHSISITSNTAPQSTQLVKALLHVVHAQCIATIPRETHNVT